ncbi:MAG: hypothetical protein AAF499_09780 [Pseudomonadota bacterium]
MRLSAICIITALGVSACGGGGGGTGTTTLGVSYPSASDFSALPVSSTNATSLYSGTTTTLADDTTSTPSVSADAFTYQPNSALNTLDRIVELYPTFTPRNADTLSTRQSAQCNGGGTLTLTGSAQLASAGDTLTATFNNCITAGASIHGRFSMTKLSSEVGNNDLRIDFDDLRTSDATQSVYVDGDMTIRASELGATQYASIESTRLNVKDSATGDVVFTNLSIAGELDSDGAQRLRMTYTMASDQLNGRIAVSTPTQLAFAANQTRPTTGILRIAGDGGSYVEFDADTGNLATVQMTVNNGTSTVSNTVTWDSLGGSPLTELLDF